MALCARSGETMIEVGDLVKIKIGVIGVYEEFGKGLWIVIDLQDTPNVNMKDATATIHNGRRRQKYPQIALVRL